MIRPLLSLLALAFALPSAFSLNYYFFDDINCAAGHTIPGSIGACAVAPGNPKSERECINSPILLAITGASAYYDDLGCGKSRPYICKNMGKPFKPLKVTEPSDTTTAFYIDVEIEKAYIKVMSMSEYKEHQKLSFADRHKFLKENHDEIVGLDEGGLPILPDMPEEKRPSPHP